jgi:hypothetical protein
MAKAVLSRPGGGYLPFRIRDLPARNDCDRRFGVQTYLGGRSTVSRPFCLAPKSKSFGPSCRCAPALLLTSNISPAENLKNALTRAMAKNWSSRFLMKLTGHL